MAGRSQESRGSGKGGMGTGVKVIIGIVILVLIIVAAAVLTLSITITNPEQGAAYPYLTNYAVSFPEGQQIAIGNTHIVVLSYQNELLTDIDGNREKLVYGEDRNISERGARITTLFMPIIQTNFKITLKYKGERDNRAYFDMSIYTQRQVPEYILHGLLPAAIDARPM
jgi:hypothetical protein